MSFSMASSASRSSSPSALSVITESRPAARRRMPRIDLPSTSSSPLRILMSDLNRAAVCTSFAAARACSPSLFLISTSRVTITPARRPLRFSYGGAFFGGEQVRGDADGLRAFLADHVRERGHVFPILLDHGELHDHGEVHAGHDLHAAEVEEGEADVARRAAEHVGED